MKFQICFALALSLPLLVVDRDAGAQGSCQYEPDFIVKNGMEVKVNAEQCARLVRGNKQDWPINMSFPVCLGRGEKLPEIGPAAHSLQCNRFYTDKHTVGENKLMMECALDGMFGNGVIWLKDNPEAIVYEHSHVKSRPMAYAEVVFMKNELCGNLPKMGVHYRRPSK